MNCRKCLNFYLCQLASKAMSLDGSVTMVSGEFGDSQIFERNPNIIADTLFDLLPKLCCRFDNKNKKAAKHVFLPLSPAKQDIVNLIRCYYEKLERYPTIEYLAIGLNKSRSTIQEHINMMYRDGYLVKLKPGVHARNYKVNPDYEV